MQPPPEIRATYRIQLREGVDFAGVEQHLAYLAALGVSHLYLSPIFAATPGSTHGYDAIDFNMIEPALGGRAGFERLSHAAQHVGLGILLDFVPNHMATAYENAWWREVLEWGSAAFAAASFDIDWSAPQLLLPVLGESFEDALATKRFSLEWADGRLCAVYAGAVRIPLAARSYESLLRLSGHDALVALAPLFAKATPQSWDSDRAALVRSCETDSVRTVLDETLHRTVQDLDSVRSLLKGQIWRLDDWRAGRHALTYRRFFEIAGLIGVKVESEKVFAMVHHTVLDLAGNGLIHGLRIDHIDGLSNPAAYLARLHGALPPSFPVYVEKILGQGEELRRDWPVAGTTGYEFIGNIADVMLDPRGEARLTATYQDFTAWKEPYPDAVRRAKKEIFTYNLASELTYLETSAAKFSSAPPAVHIQDAIVAIATELSVYRTYVSDQGTVAEDRAIIQNAAEDAMRRGSAPAQTIAAIADVLCNPHGAAAHAFTTRFQQTTGALMAKAVEDTLFYRYNRLIALNEVGGEPERFGAASPEVFHAAMQQRLETQHTGLLATATHDTKRGEDARARLYVLSACADDWDAAVARWRSINETLRIKDESVPVPSRNDEYLFYQALVGAWPLGTENGVDALTGLAERMTQFMQKAAREAKSMTSWLTANPAYEAALDAFVRNSLNPHQSSGFLKDVAAFCQSFAVAGACNSISQLVLKLTAPGIPDIYRGCELWDFSLVDPDNRRRFNMDVPQAMLEATRSKTLSELLTQWENGAVKLRVLSDLLHARIRHPTLFGGGYHRVTVQGSHASHALAFMRHTEDEFLLCAVPVRAGPHLFPRATPLIAPEYWDDTRIELGPEFSGFQWREVFTGRLHTAMNLALGDLLHDWPVAVLIGLRIGEIHNE